MPDTSPQKTFGLVVRFPFVLNLILAIESFADSSALRSGNAERAYS